MYIHSEPISNNDTLVNSIPHTNSPRKIISLRFQNFTILKPHCIPKIKKLTLDETNQQLTNKIRTFSADAHNTRRTHGIIQIILNEQTKIFNT